MKLLVVAPCLRGIEAKKFDGLEESDAIFMDYVDEYAYDEGFPKDTLKGGYLRFEYNEREQILYTVTEYETTRKLTPEEEKGVIDYTQGQWSDGIGEGFEQQYFDEETKEYNPEPWHVGQIAVIEYLED